MSVTDLGIDGYELEAWIGPLGSKPKARIAHEDLSEPYEMTEAHLFELENGKYALVTEEGCSCYESEQADIELFPDKQSALDSFERWVKQNQRS